MRLFHNKTLFALIVASLALILGSCKEERKPLSIHQFRSEVIEDNDASDLHQKSAEFLMQNLPQNSVSEGQMIQAYTDTIKKWHKDAKVLEEKLNELKGKYQAQYKPEFQTIWPDYFEEHIAAVINTRDKSQWGKQISEDVFLEYVLPHRLGREPAEYWIDSALNMNLDSIWLKEDVKSASEYIIDELSKRKKKFIIRFGESNPNLPDLPFSNLELLSVGSCKELTDYTTYALRGYGIPVANDFTPNYSNINSGHNWNAIVTGKDSSIPFIIPVKDTLGYFKSSHYQLSKVYRKTYSYQPQSHAAFHAALNKSQQRMADFLTNPYLIDVTDQYVPTVDIELSIQYPDANVKDLAYLFVFNNVNWVPLAWGKVGNASVSFTKVGYKAAYLPVSGDGIPFGQPIIFDDEHQPKILNPDYENLTTLKILRKYPLFPRIQGYINRMIGGEFKGANQPDFSDAELLFKVESSPGEYFNEITIKQKKAYKYIGYFGPDGSFANIAEFEIYDRQGNQLTGKVIGTEGDHEEFPERTKEKAFDGDVLTFYMSPREDSCWVGLEFQQPETISKIRFMARSDFNTIVPGDVYEVFFWDRQWYSLGKQTAQSHELSYTDVPSNALYFIHNHSGGKEERIFTYENGNPVWW